MDPTYTGAYGRIKVYQTEFLSEDFLKRLVETTNIEEMSSLLYTTFYREDMDKFSALNKGIDLLNMAINPRLIARNRITLFAAPTPGREIIRAYLSKRDIENIKSIISSKYIGYEIRESESFLISFRDVPIGLFGGAMTHDDFKALLSLSSIDEIVNRLSNYGYGQDIMQQMDRYRKVNDIGILLAALDTHYYNNLQNSLKFYNGDEGPLMRFIAEEIDVRNIMVVLKGVDLGVEFDRIKEGLISNGNISVSSLQDIYSSGYIEQSVEKLKRYYPDTEEALKAYQENRRLEGFESLMVDSLYRKYIEVFSQQSLSAGSTFNFIMKSERERERLRSIIFGKHYGLSNESIMGLASL